MRYSCKRPKDETYAHREPKTFPSVCYHSLLLVVYIGSRLTHFFAACAHCENGLNSLMEAERSV